MPSLVTVVRLPRALGALLSRYAVRAPTCTSQQCPHSAVCVVVFVCLRAPLGLGWQIWGRDCSPKAVLRGHTERVCDVQFHPEYNSSSPSLGKVCAHRVTCCLFRTIRT